MRKLVTSVLFALLIAMALSSSAAFAQIKMTPEKLKALESLPGSNTPEGQADPRAVIRTVAPTLSCPVTKGKMMTPVYPEAKNYPMQPQVFAEKSYVFPAPSGIGMAVPLTPFVQWKVVDPKGEMEWGEWVLSLSASGDLKVKDDRYMYEGGTGAMVVTLFCANNPHLCWVDTAWVKDGGNSATSTVR